MTYKGVTNHMLANVLALVVGLGSIALYTAAFFFPEIHRKYDFIWSGVGFFYALVLWIFAPRITGGLLLGHVASVALLGWFGWQTLSMRRQLTPITQQTQIPSAEETKTNLQPLQERLASLQQWFSRTFSGPKDRVRHTQGTKTPETPKATISPSTAVPTVKIVDHRTSTSEQLTTESEQPAEAFILDDTEAKNQLVTEQIPPNPPSWQSVEAIQEIAEDKAQSVPMVEVTPPVEVPTEHPPNSSSQGS